MPELAIFKLTGVFAAVWMLAGVVLVARKFPGYSHTNQVMSELGARGRPTSRIHPLINNYPIGALYILFGISITISYWEDLSTMAIGLLITIHGLCHLVTGLSPCDEDLGIPKASSTQIIHNTAGVIMLVSLLAASTMGAMSSVVAPQWFRAFSLVCLVVSVMFTILMAISFSTVQNIGLYQRISYSALVVWVAVFSGITYYDS